MNAVMDWKYSSAHSYTVGIAHRRVAHSYAPKFAGPVPIQQDSVGLRFSQNALETIKSRAFTRSTDCTGWAIRTYNCVLFCFSINRSP